MTDADRPGAEEWVPESESLSRLREAVPDCRGCELWRNATQAVFGDGERGAPLMLVGEQPGDREDLAGEPFVGPAGRILDQAIQLAGLTRQDTYVTNAVKHFRFELRGKRRLHQKPDVGNIDACRPWLEAEIRAVDPRVIVCLGATAARAVLGRPVRIGAERGAPIQARGRIVIITTHPSAILRLPGESERATALDELAADLSLASRSATAPA